MPPKISLKTYIALLTTLIFWSSSFVAIRSAVHSYHPGSLAFLRYIIASICLLPLFIKLPKSQRRLPEGKDWLKIMALGVVGFSIYNVSLNYGEITVTAAIASFIVSLIPVGVVLIAWCVLKEKMTLQSWIGLAISVFGVTIIAISENQNSEIHNYSGIACLLVTAIAGAIYSALHKPLLKRYHPIAFTALAIWSGTLFMAVYLPELIHDIMQAKLSATLAVIYLGIFPGAIGYVTWSYTLRHMPATKASSFLYLMPLFAIGLGWLFLNEIPRFWPLMGGLVALSGAVVVNAKIYLGKTAQQS